MKFFNIVSLSYNNFSLKTYEIADNDENERIFFNLFDDFDFFNQNSDENEITNQNEFFSFLSKLFMN